MIALEFCGFGSPPGNGLGECLDAAGVDASVGQARPANGDGVAWCCNDALASAKGAWLLDAFTDRRRTHCRVLR